MERVARFTQADIITSIDGFVSKTELGLCHQFQLQKYVFPDGKSECYTCVIPSWALRHGWLHILDHIQNNSLMI